MFFIFQQKTRLTRLYAGGGGSSTRLEDVKKNGKNI